MEVHHGGQRDFRPNPVHQGLKVLDGVHGVVLRVVVPGLDELRLIGLPQADGVSVLHVKGPYQLRRGALSGEVQQGDEGGIGGGLIEGGLGAHHGGGAALLTDKFSGDRLHQLQKGLIGVLAGAAVVDIQPGGHPVLAVRLTGDGQLGLGGEAVSAGGQQHLIDGAVPGGVGHLSVLVVSTGL